MADQVELSTDIYERLFDANVRLEAAWPFPVSPASDELLQALEDSEDRLPEPLVALLQGWSKDERNELFSGGHRAHDAFSELCASAFGKGVFGWIGVAAVPVFDPMPSGNGASFSWGHYSLELMFAPTADALLTAAAEWGEKQYSDAIEAAKSETEAA